MPIPSLGHELGIMFGFIGLMVVSMVVYTGFWKSEFSHSRALSGYQESGYEEAC
jgi:high-affinity Fe2+/Pb2+ permease